MQYVDQEGHPVSLGKQIGKGGEGTVFAVQGTPGVVAKIYNRPRTPDEAAKLAAMVPLASTEILQFAAWPIKCLYTSSRREVIGLVLPWIKDSREIHELYSPAHRKLHYPKADWRFLLRVAKNCAIALGKLHARGIVVGDVNQKNILVSQQAMVSLLDCDSFQFQVNGRLFRCPVGMADYVPPELQEVHLTNVTRSSNHDSFGLANVIFHLLFMGRHPFAGRYAGSGEMPIERAIKEFRFAYSASAARSNMAPPPHALSLAAVPQPMGVLFERAFAKGSEIANARPSAEVWAQTLEQLEGQVRQCPNDSGHYYFAALSTCPWCGIVRAGGPNFFISVTIESAIARSASFDLSAIWAQIQAVPRPDQAFVPAPRFATSQIKPSPFQAGTDELKLMRNVVGLISLGFGILTVPACLYPPLALCLLLISGFFAVFWIVLKAQSPLGRVKRERTQLSRQKMGELNTVRAQQAALAKQYLSRFEQQFESLRQVADSYGKIKQQRDAELHGLSQQVRQRQLEAHLQQCFVSGAKISGIGPSRVQALESYGIETAFDITRQSVLNVPGFGEKMTDKLLGWRRQMEQVFQFNPAQGVPRTDLQALEMKYAQRRAQSERVLEQGSHELRGITNAGKGEVERLDAQIARLEYDSAQLSADLRVFETIPWWE